MMKVSFYFRKRVVKIFGKEMDATCKRKKSIDSIPEQYEGFINKLVTDIRILSRYSENGIKWKNRKNGNEAYQPTKIEHICNIVTHGFWILPAAYAALLLIFRSQSFDHVYVAIVYGVSLFMLFCISTAFHVISYLNHNLFLKDVLHRCDRAMIYIFISSSYFPWLCLPSHQHHMIAHLKWIIWAMAIFGISYQQVSGFYVRSCS
jgi:predicted membrane channel-forming protein YqfA (hemolysin III family)